MGICCEAIITFPVLKQNLWGHKFKYDHKQKQLIWWVITQDMDCYKQQTENLTPQYT